jgi:hypothetical protein
MGFKKAAQSAPFATLAFAVAHELSHIILYSVNHALQHDERAVDLTAMHFGFAEAYAEGKVRVVDTFETKQKRHSGRVGTMLDVFGLNQTDITLHTRMGEVGYLTAQEMHYACSWIMHRRL